jgi:drug/metabolite transporter (DMT)-like permease
LTLATTLDRRALVVSRTSAGRLGATTYFVPAVVVVMAWLLLGEVPPPLAIVGGGVCIGGVVVVRTSGLGPWRGGRAGADAGGGA